MASVRIKTSSLALEIPDRAFAVLAGPSGSGKSVLLRLIAGLEKAAEGEEVILGEKSVGDAKAGGREVAMVAAEDALYPRMTLRDNIAFGLRQRKFSSSETKRRVEDAAAALGITDSLELRPADVSAEQRQRAAIARAVARQPKVVLMDEPLAGFDAVARARLCADLRKLHERLEATIIYATCDVAEAMALAERIIVLRDGRVEQEGALAEVYERPVNLFVAGFLGVPPMNLIQGTLKLERESLLFREANEGTIEVRLPLAGRAAAEEWAGKAVVLGIRPEDVELIQAAKGQEPVNSFPALIDFIETAGGGVRFHLQTGSHEMVAIGRRNQDGQPAGRRGRFLFDPEQAHLFDPTSLQRISGA